MEEEGELESEQRYMKKTQLAIAGSEDGKQAASNSWKKQRNGFSPSAS